MKQAASKLGRGDCKEPGEAARVFLRRHGVPLEPIGVRKLGVLVTSLEELIKRLQTQKRRARSLRQYRA
jgi:hypothetical protein